MGRFKDILLYVHQLPQNLVGLIVRLLYKGGKRCVIADITVYYLETFRGGISLGNTIMVGSRDISTVKHEHGHQIQSLYLGWLYLFVIGIPSIVWAMLYDLHCINSRWSYYDFYTEKWADNLGCVHRIKRT